jgi:hypothetical protein
MGQGAAHMSIKSALWQRRRAARQSNLSRRHFLRGIGACVALPALPSLLSRGALATTIVSPAGLAGTSVLGAPLRMAFMTIPNGVHQANWWPTGGGREFELGPTMQSLADLQGKIQVLGGLDHINATAGKDGPGDHARAAATLLTGCRAKKTAGADIFVGPSIDQLAAQKIGHLTRFPSLELTTDSVRTSGGCDSGYSCAYQFNVSWRSSTTPVPPERNPRLVFERLFGAGDAAQRRRNFMLRQERQRSILDFVREDAQSLRQRLGVQDERKLDEYLTSVREVERRIEQAERFGELPDPGIDTPAGIPRKVEEHIQLMYDMLLIAFQTDSTRIATLILGHDGSNRSFPDIGVNQGHHDLSHHENRAENLEKIAKIDQHYMSFFAEFLKKLDQTPDVDGNSLLHNSMIVYAGGNADGNRHSHNNLPVILAGAAGGRLQAGRYHKVRSMPMSNMFLEMAEHMGIEDVEKFGDSDNRRVSI